MADKQIHELAAAQVITNDDLLVVEQNNAAKKLPGKVLSDFVIQAAGVAVDTQLATLAQRSAKPGSIITFEDGADDIPLRHLEFDITPVQDLHGYDNPWPGGGGKNLAECTAQSQTVNNVAYVVDSNGIVTANGTASDTSLLIYGNVNLKAGSYILNGLPSNGSNTTFSIQLLDVSVVKETLETVADAPFTVAEDVTYTVRLVVRSGYTASNLVFKPMIRLATEADASFAPYENICPISGHTECNVTRTGKNLTAFESGAITVYGVHTDNNARIRCPDYIKIVAGETYTFTAEADTALQVMVYFYADNNNSEKINDASWQSVPYTFVAPTGAKYTTVVIRRTSNTTLPESSITSFQLELGSIATDYEPFGRTYSISFPTEAGTVYSGHVTVEKDGSGSLVVDTGIATENTFTNQPTHKSNNEMEYYVTVDNVGAIGDGWGICNMLKNDPQNAWEDNYPVCQVSPAGDRIRVYGTFTTLTEFRQQYTGLQICYHLATPITYTLDPVQVKSLLGLNNVWVNTGDITDLMYYVGGEYKDAEDKRDIIEATIPYDAASGAIATFPDGADNVRLKQLSVGINPVQDLHGYDNPWPGGGGKNLLNAIGTVDNANLINGEYTITTVPSATVQFVVGSVYLTVGNYILNGALNTNFRIYGSVNGSTVACTGEDAPFSVSEAGTFEFKGLITASATMGQKLSPMIRLATETDAAFAPYTNICPITGYTGAEVTRTGKNVYDASSDVTGSRIDADGTIATSSGMQYSQLIPVESSSIYTFSLLSASNSATYTVNGYGEDGAWKTNLVSATTTASSRRYTYSVSVPSDVRYVRISRSTTRVNQVQLEHDTTVSDYETYQGTTYPITFPSEAGTVYDGHVTIEKDGSGTLVVSTRYTIFPSDSYWAWNSSIKGFLVSSSIMLSGNLYLDKRATCNVFPKVESSTTATNACVTFSNQRIAFCNLDTIGINDVATWKAFLNANEVSAVYPLATPITIPLTAPQITTLLGTNNLWSDTNGDVSVNYPCDVGLYITKKLEELVGDNG